MKYSSSRDDSTPRFFAMSLDVTPAPSEWRQNACGSSARNWVFLPKVSITAELSARFFTVLMPSMMIARTSEFTFVFTP